MRNANAKHYPQTNCASTVLGACVRMATDYGDDRWRRCWNPPNTYTTINRL